MAFVKHGTCMKQVERIVWGVYTCPKCGHKDLGADTSGADPIKTASAKLMCPECCVEMTVAVTADPPVTV